MPLLIHSRCVYALGLPCYTFHSNVIYVIPVCAVASRFYAAKSEIYPIAMHFAKHAAANALITGTLFCCFGVPSWVRTNADCPTQGWKSVELAQAYFFLSIFGTPAKRWEEDRSWLYIGLAIRYVKCAARASSY